MKLQGAVIAITGASRGLGQAMATALASKGCRLALLDRQSVEQTAALCHELGAEVFCTELDITDEASVEQTFADIATHFGALDGLVNNAGIMRDGLLIKVKQGEVVDKMSAEQFRSVMDVNLTGAFLCGREAASQMVRLGRPGAIVNISSVSRAGNFGQSNYSASKAALVAMTVTWAKELARFKIRTGAVAPGPVATAMTAQMRPEELDRLVSAVPLGRIGEADEIVQAVRFILENEYFTGRVVEVDGGIRI